MSDNDPFRNANNPYSFADTPQVSQRGLVHQVTVVSILSIVQGTLVTVYGIGMIGLAFVMPILLQAQSGIAVAPVTVAPLPDPQISAPPVPVVPVPIVPAPFAPTPDSQISDPPVFVAPPPFAEAPDSQISDPPVPVTPLPAGPGPAAPMPAGFNTMIMATYGSMGLVLFVIGVTGIWAGIRMLRFRGRTLGFVALSSGLLSVVGCYCFPTAIGLFIYGLIVLLNPSVKRAFEMGEEGYTAQEIQDHFARLSG